MTRLKMHWELTQGADGKKFLSMRCEAAQAGVMPACACPQSTEVQHDRRHDAHSHTKSRKVIDNSLASDTIVLGAELGEDTGRSYRSNGSGAARRFSDCEQRSHGNEAEHRK